MKMTEKHFVTKLEKTFRREGFFTKRELGVGYGVADLVLFIPHTSHCLKRIKHNQSTRLLHEGYFRVFNSLPDAESGEQAMSIAQLQIATSYSRALLKYTLLPHLRRAKYVVESEAGYYMKINGWLPIGRELIAIEAKLHDWKRGFFQANRYSVFADKVYLAVPPHVSNLVDKQLLKTHGVGLIVFDPIRGTKKTILAAASRKASNDSQRNLASEFFWNTKLRKLLSA